MGEGAKPPALSEAGRKAFDAFRELPFAGSGFAEDMRATVALCAMYDMQYEAEGRYVANTSREGYRTTTQQVRTFVDATQQLLQFMNNPRAQHFDISKMGGAIGSQSDAKDYARSLINTLREEVKRDFPAQYQQGMNAISSDEQQMWKL